MSKDKVNLFVYGSLRDHKIFQSVCGLDFTRNISRVDGYQVLLAEPALLSGHRRVSPDNVYFYAVASESSRIEGLIIHDVPEQAMSEIDKYEGQRYERETVQVSTGSGPVKAQAFLVSHDAMKKHFGDRFHVNLIHELWLRKRIERFIKKRTRRGERTVDAEAERRADRELLATTERDLVISHYRNDAVSDYYLEHELDRPRLSIRHLYDDSQAMPFINNYLALVVKQVLLNQLEEHIQTQYRFELEHMRTSKRYFARSVSLLAAMQIINSNYSAVDMILKDCPSRMPYDKNDLIDYVKYGVRAAREFFDRRVVSDKLARIRANLRFGLIPMGLEIELSNLGPAAVEPKRSLLKAFDPIYDGFKYFCDFGLDVLMWKLGGYIDDHSGAIDRRRRSGFLELAPGRLNLAGELSRPSTAAPWLLNQLIHEIVEFYNIPPHSLHLSFQLRKNQIGKQKVLPLDFVKCLLALGGGPELKGAGRLWVSRMVYDEITQPPVRGAVPKAAGALRGNDRVKEELVFARTNKRKWYLVLDDIGEKIPAQATTYVQQYKFIRLDERANYEPLIMCLKGLQLSYNPGDYLTAEQLNSSRRLREDFELLKKWSLKPEKISAYTINKFVKTVREGLLNEGHRKPAHEMHYIDWALTAIDMQLRMFNQQVKKTEQLSIST
jgi:gamma-glutamylcyclotransferase (GGCT)/AIG2-like uncharacterized protein YtfP